MVDKTLKDSPRREISLHDIKSVESVIPEHFLADYQKLVILLEKYYEFTQSTVSPSSELNKIYDGKDVLSIDPNFLKYITDKLLINQNRFVSDDVKRLSVLYSNDFYRSKGTKYSIEQFFRAYFGVTPEVVYTKNNVFILNESQIGPESLRYLINDKLYQTFALLIRTEIPTSDWIDDYKTFVHPAGMYVEGEVTIVSVGTAATSAPAMPDLLEVVDDPIFLSVATATPESFDDVTGIVSKSVDSSTRITLDKNIEYYQGIPMAILDKQYDTVEEWAGTNSPTFDEDSAIGDDRAPRMSNTTDTLDETNYVYYEDSSP